MKVTVELSPSDFPEATKLLSILQQVIPIYKQIRSVEQIIIELDASNLEQSVEEITCIFEQPHVIALAKKIVDSFNEYIDSAVFESLIKRFFFFCLSLSAYFFVGNIYLLLFCRLPATVQTHITKIVKSNLCAEIKPTDLFPQIKLYEILSKMDLLSANGIFLSCL